MERGLMSTRVLLKITTAMQMFAEPSQANNPWWASSGATLIAALVAAVAAITGAIIAAVAASRTAKLQRELEQRERGVEYRRRQLNELYGPLYMLRQASSRLYDVLLERMRVSEEAREDWRLVDHIEQIHKSNDQLAQSSVTKILDNNAQVVELLKGRWGLLELEPTTEGDDKISVHETFVRFMAHAALLQHAWENKTNQSSDTRTVFPREIDEDIEKDLKHIRAELANLNASTKNAKQYTGD